MVRGDERCLYLIEYPHEAASQHVSRQSRKLLGSISGDISADIPE